MNLRHSRIIAIALTGFYASAPVVFGQVTNFPPAGSSMPEVGFSLLRLIGALVLVLALFLGGVWLFKHWQRLTVLRGKAPKLHLLEVRSLGNRHALYVVGYEQQRLLLASSPTGVTLLTHLPGGELDPPELATPPPGNFAQTLQRVLSAKA